MTAKNPTTLNDFSNPADSDRRDTLSMLDDLSAKVTKDLVVFARGMSRRDARLLVDAYYQMQSDRMRSVARAREAAEAGEPSMVLSWLGDRSQQLEDSLRRLLTAYSGTHPVGMWMRAQVGIGPVTSAGLLAHIDMERAPTVGHIWRVAGLDPTSKWEKGGKRPWSADFKKLCYLIGESFVKVSGNPQAYYAQVYLKRKRYEWENNLQGQYADQCDAKLADTKIVDADTRAWYTGKYDTVAFDYREVGYSTAYGNPRPHEAEPGCGVKMLPPGRIHLRAKRYAVKLFLSHVHDVWYREIHGAAPPLPYPIAHLGHAHYLKPPPAPVEA